MPSPNIPERPVKGRIQTEADTQSMDRKSGQTNKSSQDQKSHNKAGKDTGVGGGKKQGRNH